MKETPTPSSQLSIMALVGLLVSVSAIFPQPAERRSINGVLETTLAVDVSRYTGENVSFMTRMYEGSVPGPTLRVRAGDTLILLLDNRLGPNDPANNCPQTAMMDPVFALCEPNTTNLHVHGVHVPPDEDNVNLNVTPGSMRTYQYHFPRDHPTGAFWYHPHHIPGDLIQQLGGMSGLIIVDAATDGDADGDAVDDAEGRGLSAFMGETPVVLNKWMW